MVLRMNQASNQRPSRRPSLTPLLAHLLSRWSRQKICGAMARCGAGSAALRDGRVEKLLAGIGQRPRAWPGFGRHKLVGRFDADFPLLLSQIPDPPLVLAYEGALEALTLPTVAIVGARRCTLQGRRWARAVSRELAAAGCCIVSGLALGIDGESHEGALEAGGRTAAFLGCGLDKVYPARHSGLARRIVAAGGVLLSEYPGAFQPLPHQFPERNRLISGAAVAVIVVEANEKSGSLITARFATEQGRDVLAVPGPVFGRVSSGCNRLIQQGAGLVTDAGDVLDAMGLESNHRATLRPPPQDLDAEAEALLALIDGGAAGLDELAAHCGRAQIDIVQTLGRLELAGIVARGPLGYIRTS